MNVCGAKTRAGAQCQNASMSNGRCRMHGGSTPTGVALPQTKHGRYSKHLPTRLAGAYAEAQADGRLLELRDDIALIDARLQDVLGRVDTGESGEVWQRLVKAKVEVLTAPKEEKTARLADLLRLIDEGADDYAAWMDVRSLVEQRRKLVESERKRLVEMQQTITAERAMLLIGAITGIIKAHVTDSAQLGAIAADIGALVAPTSRGVVDAN